MFANQAYEAISLINAFRNYPSKGFARLDCYMILEN